MSDPRPEPEDPPFWEQPETVARFADRDPDHRLTSMVEEYPDPASVRVLDLGCAGGRNAVLLAERGFDLLALDGSAAMVAETRRRIAPLLGEREAASRVRVARMDRLEGVEDESFDLVVALGIYHQAESREEWDAAIRETVRALRPGGRLLVAVHTDEADLDGTGLTPVEGEPHVFLRTGRRHFLVDAGTLDAEMARHGLAPVEPTETVRKETERGVRVTANALYRKRP